LSTASTTYVWNQASEASLSFLRIPLLGQLFMGFVVRRRDFNVCKGIGGSLPLSHHADKAAISTARHVPPPHWRPEPEIGGKCGSQSFRLLLIQWLYKTLRQLGV
jgi:hypothetical protein